MVEEVHFGVVTGLVPVRVRFARNGRCHAHITYCAGSRLRRVRSFGNTCNHFEVSPAKVSRTARAWREAAAEPEALT